ncbi:MAG TPA: SIS domain-containing protein, partial [Flexilinea sp.]|nr:SIS domain-containing protein [Flexilinea sp.]
EPLKALAGPGDILIAISGSGNSANILRGLETAREIGLKTIGLSGFKGGQMISMVDLPINIDTDSIERVEDLHMVCDHLLTMVLREIAMHELEGKR